MDDKESEIIKRGYPTSAEDVLMIDFDGTIAPFGHMFSYPEPLLGAVETMQLLKSYGYVLGIFTARLDSHWLLVEDQSYVKHFDYISDFLKKNDIPFDFITGSKRPALDYIDDRATHFTCWKDIRDKYEVKEKSEPR